MFIGYSHTIWGSPCLILKQQIHCETIGKHQDNTLGLTFMQANLAKSFENEGSFQYETLADVAFNGRHRAGNRRYKTKGPSTPN